MQSFGMKASILSDQASLALKLNHSHYCITNSRLFQARFSLTIGLAFNAKTLV